MTAHLSNRTAVVTMFRKRSRGDLVEMLVRAHRHEDMAMAESCRAELDRRAQESRLAGRSSSGRR